MAKYTVLTNDKGGIIDDLIITRMADDKFFVVFNAGRKDVDIAWFEKNLAEGLAFEVMPDHALVALQGPKRRSGTWLQSLSNVNLSEFKYMRMMEAELEWHPNLY